MENNQKYVSDKHEVSGLIPYKIKDGEIFVFLQKRAEDAKIFPDYFMFFGGGMEREESPEETMKREILEELNFVPEGYAFFNSYDFGGKLTINMFILEVGDDFEENIKVMEGEYGKYLSEEEVLQEPKLTDEARIVLNDLYKYLCK